jgi:DNA-binding NarL/FixJ family response regulator
LIADDHALLRGAIKTMLASEDDLEVVGEAQDGEEAIALSRELLPDLVLMDLSMPEMDGIEATRAIKAEFPRTSVLVLTPHADQEMLLEAIRAGAAGYVLKGVGPKELVGVVRATLGGESPVDQELVMQLVRRMEEEQRLVRRLTEASTQPVYPLLEPSAGRWEKPPPGLLTPSELEVLRLLLAGNTNRQIAQGLHLSLSTVKRYLERIISKLEVCDRTQLTVKAVELGLVDPERAD